MDIKNLTGLERPLTKLIEVISKGTGILYDPVGIKRKAIAEAESLKIKSDAISEVLDKHGSAVGALALVCENEKLDFKNISELGDRALASRNYQNIIEQKNVENIIASSIESMSGQVSEREVDIDWRTRFFKKAREVSHDDMQKVWGKVLAGEVANPGTYSVRSLEVLSNLTQQEAELFRKLSGYIELTSGYIFLTERGSRQGFNHEFSYADILKLEDCGILMSQHDLSITVTFKPNIHQALRYRRGDIVLLNETANDLKINMPIIPLTSSGKELLNLVESSPWDENYFRSFQKIYSKVKVDFQ